MANIRQSRKITSKYVENECINLAFDDMHTLSTNNCRAIEVARPKNVTSEETVLLPPNCQHVSKRKHDCEFDRSSEDDKRLHKRQESEM